MRVDELVAYCLAKAGAVETHPFSEEHLVVKVGGKGFAFVDPEGGSVGVKCGRDADEAAEWRARHPEAITKMAYIGRSGWNTVAIELVPDDDVRELVDDSYDDVVSRLPRTKRPG